MTDIKIFKYSKRVLVVPALFVAAMWIVFWLNTKTTTPFNDYGIYPKTLKGLRGVLFSPFLHGSLQHLFNNSIPLFVLMASVFYFYKNVAVEVLVYGVVLTGLFTWSFARPSFHIGASGVVYLLFSFVFFSGVFSKYYRLIALSLAVIFLYGSMIWYLFPIEEKISWEGHLSGFIVGLLLAFVYRRQGPQPKEFVYRKTEFDTWFDKDGNFNPPKPDETKID